MMAAAVEVPAEARALLHRVDYEDAHEARLTMPRTARECLHRALDSSHRLIPLIRVLHRALGLKVVRPDLAHPLGWSVLRETPDRLILGAHGALFTLRIHLQIVAGRVTLATIISFEMRAAAPVWAGVAPVHRLVLRRLVDASV